MLAHGSRHQLLDRVADEIDDATVARPVRVAIDGPPAAGKTTLADELAVVLRDRGRHVIRAGIDDFMLPAAWRYRRGELSARSCYFASHDHEAMIRELLAPLGPGGDCYLRHRRYDRASDTATTGPPTLAPLDTVLLFDGVFLQRDELDDRWELRVLVTCGFGTTIDRAVSRERGATRTAVERRWRTRYIPSQQYYATTVDPAQRADIVVHNDVLERPTWVTRRR